MAEKVTVESAIRAELMRRGSCTLEALLDGLAQYSWSQVFAAIDQLSREGELTLRHPSRFGYEVSIGRTRSASADVDAGHEAEGAAVLGRAEIGSRGYEERTTA